MSFLVMEPLRYRSTRGFTIVELMIVVAIVGVLAGVAAPALFNFIAGGRVRAAASELFAATLLARSEAVKRNANVELNAIGGNWNSGWAVTSVGGGATYSTYSASEIVITVSPAVTQLVFQPNGRLASGADVSWTIAPATGTASSRCISMGASGRAKQAPC